jgi:hypothetical protein
LFCGDFLIILEQTLKGQKQPLKPAFYHPNHTRNLHTDFLMDLQMDLQNYALPKRNVTNGHTDGHTKFDKKKRFRG